MLGKNGRPRKRCYKNRWINKYSVKLKLGYLFKDEPFDLTSKYALALNIIFVSLFYSSGMPLMLLFASVSLAL